MEKLIISEQDKYILNDYRVKLDSNSGYYRVYFDSKGNYEYLHRFILGAKKGEIVDHKDRNKDNNTRENLRKVSKSLNNYNRNVKNPLGRGIYFDKSGKRFRACISFQNKTLKLGSFKTIEDAKKEYNNVSLRLRGKDAFQHILD